MAQGKLMLIGGNIDKGSELEEEEHSYESIQFFELGILKRIITELKGDSTRIEIVTTASKIPGEIGEEYVKSFNKIGCENIGLLSIGIDMDPDSPQVMERIRRCDALIFTGGDQTLLLDRIGHTNAIKELKSRYQNEKNFMVAGTSAGAMALAGIMIKHGRPSQALFKGNVSLGNGFSFISDQLIDTHFVQRGRFGRLIEAVASKPELIGIGLGEDSAVLLDNNILETVGNNLVSIIDGKDIQKNNYDSISAGEPLCIDNLGLHILARDHQFDLKTRKVL